MSDISKIFADKPTKNGSSIMYVRKTGKYVSFDDSTEQEIDITAVATKYTNRFDDIVYYGYRGEES
jgi:hypothetical protein